MKRKKWKSPIAPLVVAILMFSVLLSACQSGEPEAADPQPEAAAPQTTGYTTTDDLRGKTVGSLTGAITDQMVIDYFDNDVTMEYYDSNDAVAKALDDGLIDAFVLDEPHSLRFAEEHPNYVILDPPVKINDAAYMFQMDNERAAMLCEQMNEFLADAKADGSLDALKDKWVLGTDESIQTIDITLTGENGTVSWACCSAIGFPYCYEKDGQLVGYDVELIKQFCQTYGYDLEIVDLDLASMVEAAKTGQCDIGGTATNITEERKETILFSDVSLQNIFVLTVLDDPDAAA